MYFWIFGVILFCYVLRFLWKAYTHPAHVLGRQAANMNWIATGTLRDKNGYKDLCLARDGIEAKITKDGSVIMMKPYHPVPFKDFIEVERWLVTDTSPAPVDEEIKYYEDVDSYITSMGYYEKLLELEGTDEKYCIAAMKVRKAGYLSGQPEEVVGALIIDSASQYKKDRQYALFFLESVEAQLSDSMKQNLLRVTN